MYSAANFIVPYNPTDKSLSLQDSSNTKVGGFSVRHFEKAMVEKTQVWISLVDMKLILDFASEADAKLALTLLKTAVEELLTTLSPIKPYKSYVAFLNFSGDFPMYDYSVIYQNEIGDIVWSWDSLGAYVGTLAGAFPADKVWISYQPTIPSLPLLTMGMNRGTDDTIQAGAQQIDLGATNATRVNQFISFVEIRVYN